MIRSPPNSSVLNRSSKSTDVNVLAHEYEKLFLEDTQPRKPLGEKPRRSTNKPARSSSSPPMKHKKTSARTGSRFKKKVDFNESLSSTLGRSTSRCREQSPSEGRASPSRNQFLKEYSERVASKDSKVKSLPNVLELLGQLKGVSKEAQDLREEVASLKQTQSDDTSASELILTKQLLQQEHRRHIDSIASCEATERCSIISCQFEFFKILLKFESAHLQTSCSLGSSGRLSRAVMQEENNELRRELTRERATRQIAEERQPSSMSEEYHNEAARRAEVEREKIVLERKITELQANLLKSNLPRPATQCTSVQTVEQDTPVPQVNKQSVPMLKTAALHAVPKHTLVKVLKGVYSRHDPMKIDKISTIADEWKGKESVFMEIVKKEYGLTDDALRRYSVEAEVTTPRMVSKATSRRSHTPVKVKSRSQSTELNSSPRRSGSARAFGRNPSRNPTPVRSAPFHRSSSSQIKPQAGIRNFPHRAPEIKLSNFYPGGKRGSVPEFAG
eukprot:TRINITY_DN834_c8_g1_i1.p1 TRINITY_DN834_c8_g1~~TRINITY_DN834_c8_g1_i1.p1  ORF type:complete len:515 (+),score=58.26 TRINITY_DN834_c8_g1_i1:39-1547(+)